MVKILCWFIRCYKRLLSPLLGRNCRFYPSCSSYCIQALETHGVVRGCLLGMWRICRCQPFSDGGYDPVPEKSACQASSKDSAEGDTTLPGQSSAV